MVQTRDCLEREAAAGAVKDRMEGEKEALWSCLVEAEQSLASPLPSRKAQRTLHTNTSVLRTLAPFLGIGISTA